MNISGKVKYRHSNQYYNEDGVPFHSKEEAVAALEQSETPTQERGGMTFQ